MGTYDYKSCIAKISKRLKECDKPLVVIFAPSPSNSFCNFFFANLQKSTKVKDIFENEIGRIVGTYPPGFDNDEFLFDDCKHVFHEHFPDKEFKFNRA